jgi:hypothetical protein
MTVFSLSQKRFQPQITTNYKKKRKEKRVGIFFLFLFNIKCNVHEINILKEAWEPLSFNLLSAERMAAVELSLRCILIAPSCHRK